MPRSDRNRPSAASAVDARALVGVITAGLLLGGVASVMLRTAGEWMTPGVADAQAAGNGAVGSSPVNAAVKPAPAKSTGGATAAVNPLVARSKRGAPARVTMSPVPAAGGAPGTAALPTAGAVVQSAAHVDEQVAYQYNALGRRDPFQSLLNGEYVGSEVGGALPPDVGGLKVVGIVWGDADQFALVEDARGDSHILRRGDKVMNGYVDVLKRDAMIVNLTLDGQAQSVRVPLTRKGEKANGNR